MPTCLGHVEEILFLSQGPVLGAPCRPRNASDGCIPDRLGGGHEWPPCPRSVEWSLSHVAHQLPGDAGRVSSTVKHFLPDLRNHNVANARQTTAVVSYINHQGGLRSRPLCNAGAPDSLGGPRTSSSRWRAESIYWAYPCREHILSRQGPRPGGMEASPRGGEADLESFWPGEQWICLRLIRHRHCPLWYSLTHPAPLGMDAMVHDVAEASSVRLSPIALLPGVLERVRRDGAPAVASSPVLAWPSMVLGPYFSPRTALHGRIVQSVEISSHKRRV